MRKIDGRPISGLLAALILAAGCQGSLAGLVPEGVPPPPAACERPARPWADAGAGTSGAGSERPTATSPSLSVGVGAIAGDDRLTHPGGFGAAWLPDRRRVVTVGSGVLFVWDAASGMAERVISPLPVTGDVGAVAVSPDGRYVAFSQRTVQWTSQRQVGLVDLERAEGHRLGEVLGEDLRFSTDGARLMTGWAIFDVASRDRVWAGWRPTDPDEELRPCAPRTTPDTAGGAPIWRLHPCGALMLPDGRHAVHISGVQPRGERQTGADPHWSVDVWAYGASAPEANLFTLRGVVDKPPRLFWSADRGHLAVWSDGRLLVRRVGDRQLVGAVEEPDEPDHVAISNDGRLLLTTWNTVTRRAGPYDRVQIELPGRPRAHLWRLPTGEMAWRADRTTPERLIHQGVFSPDGAVLLGRRPTDDGTVALDAAAGEVLASTDEALDFGWPTSTHAIVARDGGVAVLGLRTLAPTVERPPPHVLAVAPGGGAIVTVSDRGRLRLEGRGGRCRLLHDDALALPLEAIAFSPDGRRLMALVDFDPPEVWIWRGADGAPVRRWVAEAPGATILDPANARLLFQARDGGDRYAWISLLDGAVEERLEAPERPARSGAPGAGRRFPIPLHAVTEPLLSPAGDEMIDHLGTSLRLWPLSPDGGLIREHITDHPITAVAFLDAERIAVGRQDGRLLIFERVGERFVETATHHTGPVTALTVDASGRWLASAGRGGTIAIQDLHHRQTVATFDLSPRHDWASHLRFEDDGARLTAFTTRGMRVDFSLGQPTAQLSPRIRLGQGR